MIWMAWETCVYCWASASFYYFCVHFHETWCMPLGRHVVSITNRFCWIIHLPVGIPSLFFSSPATSFFDHTFLYIPMLRYRKQTSLTSKNFPDNLSIYALGSDSKAWGIVRIAVQLSVTNTHWWEILKVKNITVQSMYCCSSVKHSWCLL